MKANELRIGNWVDIVNSDTSTTIQASTFSLGKLIEVNYKPIKIDEHWLERLGFKQNKYDKVFEIENCQIEIYFFDNDIKCTVCVDSVINKNIKHVHQLQNLYFALTGSVYCPKIG